MWLFGIFFKKNNSSDSQKKIEQVEKKTSDIEHHVAQIEGKIDPLRTMIEQMQSRDFTVNFRRHA